MKATSRIVVTIRYAAFSIGTASLRSAVAPARQGIARPCVVPVESVVGGGGRFATAV
jgi:hypothetical protein